MEKSHDNESNASLQILGAAIIGVAKGGALGILFAPKKGSKTRKNIMAKGDHMKETLLDKFSELKESFQKETDEMKEAIGLSSKNGNLKV